jgi:hypothetical protein
MTFLQNSTSKWRPYPTEVGLLSKARLMLPVPGGIYGMPGNRIAITSNHQPTLVQLGEKEGITSLALDGGGFPLKVALAFNLLKPPSENFNDAYEKNTSANITIYVPHCLSLAWNWHDGELRLGGTVKIVTDNFSENDPLPVAKIPGLIIRLFTAARLVVAQLFLMAIPIAVVNLSALIPAAVVMVTLSLLLAGFWNLLPGSGWVKGIVSGIACVVTMALLGAFQIFHFQPFIYAGVFIAISWLGGLFMGARDAA